VKVRSLIAISFALQTSVFASNDAFVIFNPPWDQQYSLQNPSLHWHLEGIYRKVASQEFTTSGPSKGSHLHYSDAFASGYYTHFIDPKNALVGQVGYAYMGLHWDQNPRFTQQDFHLALASLSWISNSMDNWRWIINMGSTIDAVTFNYWESGVFYGMLWGRYHFADWLGLHAGFLGYTGVGTGFVFPIFGADWTPNKHWKINAIFPLDISVEYLFDDHWSTSLNYATFGGPYRYPYRVRGGHGKYREAVVQAYSKGIELDLEYKLKPNFVASIGGGWNFGGWVLIKNRHGTHGRYFKFNSAPYAQASIAFTF
jgi:hypothetical protein